MATDTPGYFVVLLWQPRNSALPRKHWKEAGNGVVHHLAAPGSGLTERAAGSLATNLARRPLSTSTQSTTEVPTTEDTHVVQMTCYGDADVRLTLITG
jgi:hypothetical protein